MATRAIFCLALVLTVLGFARAKASANPLRKIVIDEDTAGPAGTDLQAVLVLIQSRRIQPLGITVVTGDQWRDEEVAHALRLLELAGRPDIPVVPGAVYPLVRTLPGTQLWQERYGRIEYQGAWTPARFHPPFLVPPLAEGVPHIMPLHEDAAHFLIQMVHKFPHQVTIFEGGPMTNLALALSLDPHFARLARGLVFMGGSIDPHTTDPEFATSPQHEFNLWFDPEAAHIVLRAHWPRITCTPVDVSIQTRFTESMLRQIKRSETPAARYLAKFAQVNEQHPDYMWDELAAAAWLDPSIITEEKTLYIDVDISHGAGYGNTLTWTPADKPTTGVQPVHVQFRVNVAKFDRLFVRLMTTPTPKPGNP